MDIIDKNAMTHESETKLAKTASTEELRLRLELEEDVEKSLEDELKDGIYSLAMRLHRLYQHKTRRGRDKNLMSEVNISIKMEGETKIEMKETKKGPRGEKGPSIRNARLDNSQGVERRKKKFEWEKSLRGSGSGKNESENLKKKEFEWKW